MKTVLPIALAGITALIAARPAGPVPLRTAHEWKIDPVHSSCVFRIEHMGTAPFYGGFATLEGGITLDPEDPAAGKVDVKIAADSVWTKNDQRDAHLKSPDFFDVAEHPQITFTSEAIEQLDEDRYKVDGVLTLIGVSKPVSLTVRKTGEGEFQDVPIIGFAIEVTIRRSDFGMEYGIADGMIGDDVHLMIGIEARAEED